MNNELKKFLDYSISSATDNTKIDVFPIPCGLGKSEYIKYMMANYITNNKGLIIITDELERLKGYTSAMSSNLTEYIERNRHKITILESQNIGDVIKSINYKPILLMTTQRYFNLSREQIIALTKFNDGERKTIVFDEKPYIIINRKLSIKSLNNISTAFKEALDNEVNQNDKELLITEWANINAYLQEILADNEKANGGYKLERYAQLAVNKISISFTNIFNKYADKIFKYDIEIYKDILATFKLFQEGLITSQKKKKGIDGSQTYDNFFTVSINNVDKLTNLGDAKVFVLDGTADISPDYKIKCFNFINCNQFKRDLSNLKINIVNHTTSKSKFNSNAKNHLTPLIDYLKAQPEKQDVIFTYKEIESKLKNDFDIVAHFGAIKGSNTYRDMANLCQIGLNRYPDLVYFLYANAIGQANDKLENNNILINRIYEKYCIDDLMNHQLLADIEQNIFRSKIRNINNSNIVTYTLVFNTSQYSELIKLLKRRYEPLGATINIINDVPDFEISKAKNRKSKTDTTKQKFLNWVQVQPASREFKKNDLINELAITSDQFKRLRRDGWLNEYVTSKKGIYKISNKGAKYL